VRADAKVMQSFRGGGRWREDEKKQTVLAAGREKVGIKEEKEKVRELAGGVLFCSEGPRDDFAASSPGALECGRWAEMRAATRQCAGRRLPRAERATRAGVHVHAVNCG
jgi:hypothetical protein